MTPNERTHAERPSLPKLLDEVITMMMREDVMPSPIGGCNMRIEHFLGLLHDLKQARSKLDAAKPAQGATFSEADAKALQSIAAKFTSSNSVPVERATITRAEWEAICAYVREGEAVLESTRSALEAAQAPERRAVTDEDVELVGAALYVYWNDVKDSVRDKYREKVRAALESLAGVPAAQPAPDVAGEPVAWIKLFENGPASFWRNGDCAPDDALPLYLHPASAASEADARDAAIADLKTLQREMRDHRIAIGHQSLTVLAWADRLSRALAAQQRKGGGKVACTTCAGRGEVGGFLSVHDGYQTDPCPDCQSEVESK